MSTGTVVTGGGIDLYRWLVMRSGIKLEAKGLCRRGRSCTAIAKAELGVTGNRAKVLEAVEAKIAELETALKPGEIRELA